MAVWLQYFGAGCLGIAIGIVLDHFGVIGGEEEGASGEWLWWAAGFLVGGSLLFWVGTALRHRRR